MKAYQGFEITYSREGSFTKHSMKVKASAKTEAMAKFKERAYKAEESTVLSCVATIIEEREFEDRATKDDFKCARTLIDQILKRGYSISVNDGEEETVTESVDKNEIKEALCTTDEDFVIVYDSTGDYICKFWLIWNNGSEGDPLILIADIGYSVVTEGKMNEIYNEVERIHS